MMAMSFIYPILASVLYVIVFQKAGFRGGILAVCAGPVLGVVIVMLLMGAAMAGVGPSMLLVSLASALLSLLPLILLAFMAWPPVSVAPSSTEK